MYLVRRRVENIRHGAGMNVSDEAGVNTDLYLVCSRVEYTCYEAGMNISDRRRGEY